MKYFHFFSHRLWHPENSVQQKNIQFFIFDQVQRNLRENVLQNGDTELILSNISGKNSIKPLLQMVNENTFDEYFIECQ